ncbi:MAG: VPLPA-CTERM-specific exosortase XrtD [Pseudomonadota bacterium]
MSGQSSGQATGQAAGPRIGLAGGMELGRGALLMSLNLIAAAFFFSYGVEALLLAWSTPEYSHGPIIPLLSGYMFLREMKAVPPATGPVTDRGVGVALVLFSLAVAFLGLLVKIPDIVTYALILWVGGTILVSFGLRRGWYFWPSVLHLVFMLPLPQFIYWPVSLWLQGVSSEIGVEIVRFFGIAVYLDGHTIDLGNYKLLVAEACSGLRYLFPVMSFSYVFGVLYTGPRWHKIVLLLSAAPITVLMNSVRIGIIGVMVDNFGISYAEGFLHLFEGWVIFISCIAMLFGLAMLMRRIGGDPKPLGEAIDIDFSGLGAQIRRYDGVVSSRALVAATVATALAAATWFGTPSRTLVKPERATLAEFPIQLGNWEGHPRVISDEIQDVLRADDYIASAYYKPGAPAPVDLYIAYYHKLTEGSAIHSPEVCLPAGGWEVSSWQEKTVAVGDAADTRFMLNRAVISKGTHRQLVWFWFEQRGRRITGDYAAKFYNIYDALTRGRTDGALVRFITPLAPGEAEASGEARLQEMLELSFPKFAAHMPE